ncbi:MAG: epoxyqueuosine reductase QueH [Patescibacteria group bacterium]
MNLLLHDCCAPCGAYVLQELLGTGYNVTVFYFNPNIFPQEEYSWRRDEMKNFCDKNKVRFIEKDYDHDDWLETIKGYENEPERGERCRMCFAKRLAETAQYASENNFEFVATTLSISPHKVTKVINEVGHEVCDLYGLKFIDIDWKKNEGYKKAVELAKKENFHRQTYCGCEFSMKK